MVLIHGRVDQIRRHYGVFQDLFPVSFGRWNQIAPFQRRIDQLRSTA